MDPYELDVVIAEAERITSYAAAVVELRKLDAELAEWVRRN